jgi:hypothetical protein
LRLVVVATLGRCLNVAEHALNHLQQGGVVCRRLLLLLLLLLLHWRLGWGWGVEAHGREFGSADGDGLVKLRQLAQVLEARNMGPWMPVIAKGEKGRGRGRGCNRQNNK